MTKHSIHVQNIFDALNDKGDGVRGELKLRCARLQDRVVSLARPGDIVAVSYDCPTLFVQYLLDLMHAQDIMIIRYKCQDRQHGNLMADSVFRSLVTDPNWDKCKKLRPSVSPYMKSIAIYKAAEAASLEVSEADWKAAKVVQRINDKSEFYKECEMIGLPIPIYYLAAKADFVDQAMALLDGKYNSLYVRPTRSGGGVGNIIIERHNMKYSFQEKSPVTLGRSDFVSRLHTYLHTGLWESFIITELLDLHASPGTLFHVDAESVRVLCHTYQILNSHRLFQGFLYPIHDERITKHFSFIERSVCLLADAWRKDGFRGYANIDWMVDKDGGCSLAEVNPRQTAVVPPLSLIRSIADWHYAENTFVPSGIGIITKDYVKLQRKMTFDHAYQIFKKAKLLIEQRDFSEGVVITMPPFQGSLINSIGIMAVAQDVSSAHEIYDSALQVLDSPEGELLFEFPR